jgi:hypothetical protein
MKEGAGLWCEATHSRRNMRFVLGFLQCFFVGIRLLFGAGKNGQSPFFEMVLFMYLKLSFFHR